MDQVFGMFLNVLGSRKHGDKCSIVIKLVAVFDNHMCSTYKIHILFDVSIFFSFFGNAIMTQETHVCGQKGIDDTLTITKRYTPLVILPIEGSIRWIGPY